MLKLTCSLMYAVLITIMIQTLAKSQELSFQVEHEVDEKKTNLAGRKPLFSPSNCKQYELFYPGDQKDDWICDCAPTTLYHPESDACFPAFRQGPCETGQILVLYKERIIPECVPNPCRTDGHFMINNRCYQFGNNNPNMNPCPLKEYTFVLGVNPRTLMVDCVQLSPQLKVRIGEDSSPEAPADYHIDVAHKCMRGSRLSSKGLCVLTN